MSRRDDVLELLRPPAHRAPLIAAGAVLFTAGLVLVEQRLDEKLPLGVHFLLLAAATALLLAVALLSPLDGAAADPVAVRAAGLRPAAARARAAAALGGAGLGAGPLGLRAHLDLARGRRRRRVPPRGGATRRSRR